MPDTHEEIPQVDKIRTLLDYINRAGATAMTDSQRKKLFKLSIRQCSVLANIRRYTLRHPEGVPMSILAERAGMSPSAASHMVDSLMSQGMIERRQSPTDRRAVLVSISKAFQDVADAIEKAQQKAVEELSAVLTDEEKAVYTSATEKLYAAIMAREGL